MEYVQTLLVQIAAARAEDAESGLLPALEAHRSYVRGQPGFLGMQVTRSINPEGNTLLVVETRWADNNSLADYSSREPNVASIVGSHADVTLPDTLQVHRMERLGAEGPRAAPTRTYDRLALALLVPLGVLAFALLVIYGLSRIYLEIPSEAATVLAAVIALAILGLCWYFATNPNVPRWQLTGVVLASVAVLAAGGAYAAVEQSDEEPQVHASPTPPPGQSPRPPGGQPPIVTHDNSFSEDALSVQAGQEVKIVIQNEGSAIHNVHVANPSGEYTQDTCNGSVPDEPCSDPARVRGGQSGELTVNFSAAGTRNFRCDFHPDEMTGTITIQ